MLQSQPARKQRISAFVSVRAAALADKRRVVSALRAFKPLLDEMETVRANNSICSLPPCGGGLGRGVVVVAHDISATATPTPNPSPQGGGEHARSATPKRVKFIGTRFGSFAASAIAMATALAGGIAIAGESADPAKLSDLVRQDCGSCHGLTLRGGLGKPLRADRLLQWDGDQLMQIILDGVPGTPMPPWRGLLTEAEVRWIVEALKSGRLR
jgi:cytochrome c55X